MPVPSYRFAALTDVGCVRDNNEDAIVINPAHGIAVLADGMGGYNAGEVASALATELTASEMARWLAEAGDVAGPHDITRAMEICVDNANRAIFDSANTHDEYAGMGTTLVMAVCHGTQLFTGHVGDSRAYRWRADALTQLTRDHSLLQEQLDAGLITPEEAATSGSRNLVTRALGVEDTVLLEVQAFDTQPDDLYLLCSDGLTDMVAEEDIAALLGVPQPLEDMAQALVASANANGGRDNIAVVLIQVVAPPRKAGMLAKLLGKAGAHNA